jgi:hypothetical protein
VLRQLARKLSILISVLSICLVIEAFPQGGKRAQTKVTRKAFSQSNTNRSTPSPTATPSRKTFKVQIEVSVDGSSEKVDGEAVELTSRENGLRFSKKERTNKEGIARFSQVPPGAIRIQMVVRQFDTFGQDYNLTDDNQTIRITLKKNQQ